MQRESLVILFVLGMATHALVCVLHTHQQQVASASASKSSNSNKATDVETCMRSRTTEEYKCYFEVTTDKAFPWAVKEFLECHNQPECDAWMAALCAAERPLFEHMAPGPAFDYATYLKPELQKVGPSDFPHLFGLSSGDHRTGTVYSYLFCGVTRECMREWSSSSERGFCDAFVYASTPRGRQLSQLAQSAAAAPQVEKPNSS